MALSAAKKLILFGKYSAEANALFARRAAAGVPSTAAQKAIDNSRIVALKAAGLWSLLDVLQVYAGETSASSLLNWKQNLYNGTIFGTVTHTASVGFQGDGTTGYIDTGFNPSTAVAPNFTQNSGAIGFWSQTAAQSAAIEMGNTNSLLICRDATNVANHRANGATSGNSVTVGDGSGLFVSSRVGALGADNRLYRNGLVLPVGLAAGASSAPDNNIITVFRRGGSGTPYSTRVCSLAFVSSGLSAQNVADLHAIFA